MTSPEKSISMETPLDRAYHESIAMQEAYLGTIPLLETSLAMTRALAIGPRRDTKDIGPVLEREPAEIIYDATPFIDEEGNKRLVYVSQRWPAAEIVTVKSSDTTWKGMWQDKKVIARTQDVPTQHNTDIHGTDIEYTLRNPKISYLEKDGKSLIVLSVTAYYPPPVRVNYRAHTALLAAEKTDGPYTYIGDMTTYTSGDIDDPRSGESMGMSELTSDGDNIVAYHYIRASRNTDEPLRIPPWQKETLIFPKKDFLELVNSKLLQTYPQYSP